MKKNKVFRHYPGIVKRQTVASAAAVLTLAAVLLLCLFGCARKEPADAPTDGTSADAVTADSITETETAQEPYTPKTVTLMVYMTGSDLESRGGLGTEDLEEMAGSGVDLDRVTLLVYTGGATDWQNGLSPERNVLLRLTSEGFVAETDFDLLSMGDPESLTRFTAYAEEHYPAEEYDLILWDHGNGPVMGYGKDKLFDNDSLTLTELGEALAAGPFGPENRLGVLGFDACLMASVELACVTADYADYLVASEELEPGIGWHYGFLSQAGLVSPRTLAHHIVDGFFSAVEEYAAARENYDADITLSVTDLRAVEPLREALEQYFADAADHVSGDYNKLASARANAKGFARGSSEYDLIDLGSLLDVRAEAGDKKAKAVREALDAAVDYSRSNVEDCSGLSLYYPYYNKYYYQNSWREDYLSLDALGSYQTYLERYEQVWLGSDLQDLFAGGLTPQSANDGRHYTLQLTPEQAEAYAKGRYYILRRNGLNQYHLLYASQNVTEEEGLLTADFDGNVIYAADDYSGLCEFMMRSIEKTNASETYYSACYLSAAGKDNVLVSLYLKKDLSTGEVSIKGIYENEEAVPEGKQKPLELTPGCSLTFYDLFNSYLTRAENGRILPFFDWESNTGEITGTCLNTGDHIRFTSEPLYDRGNEYFLMFELMDTQGNSSCSELIPITPAALPAETAPEEKTAQVFVFPAAGTLTLPLEEGITLDLNCFCSAADGRPVVQGRLNSESGGELQLTFNKLRNQQTNKTVNLYQLGDYYTADAGGAIAFAGKAAPGSLMCSGFDDPWTLAFSVSVFNDSLKKTTVPETGFLVRMPAAGSLLTGIEPFMDAMAERQLLTEKDGLRVTLLTAGRCLSYGNAAKAPGDADDSFSLWLLIENDSAEPRTFECNEIRINGLEFADTGFPVTVAPGMKKTLKLELDQFDIDVMTEWYFCFYSSFGVSSSETPYREMPKTGQITSISSVDLPMRIDGEYRICEIALCEKGDGAPVVPDGEPIYEDENLTVWAAGRRWLPDDFFADEDNRVACAYWVRNKTDDEILAFPGDTYSDPLVFTADAGALKYVLCSESFFGGKDVVETKLTWRNINSDDDMQTTGSFPLPKEGGAQP